LDSRTLDDILSSKPKLKIENALSIRPMTLAELASATGITVQGVLRHLKRLAELGLVEEKPLSTRNLKARTVYAATGEVIGNYSTSDLVVVKPTRKLPTSAPSAGKPPSLEERATDILLLRHRVSDQAKKLGRMIDELADEREALRSGVDGLHASPEEGLILGVVLTEETLEDGLSVLARYYGIEDRRSIDRALAKARRSG
jgi:DNA-binding transcriptional ArsR family regulator